MLTNTQKKLVEDNLMLAYHCAHKFMNIPIPLDERIELTFLGLVKAAHEYNPKRGNKFATFAMIVMQNEILYELRQSKKCQPTISLDCRFGEDDNMEIHDIISDKKSLIDDIETIIDFKTFIEKSNKIFTGTHKQLFQYMLAEPGMPQRYYAIKLGISQPRVSRMMKKMREEFLK